MGDGVRLRLVVEYCLYEVFDAMASADVVVLSRGPHGSLSDLLGYFTTGVVLLRVEERMLRYEPLPVRWCPVGLSGAVDERAVAASLLAGNAGAAAAGGGRGGVLISDPPWRI